MPPRDDKGGEDREPERCDGEDNEGAEGCRERGGEGAGVEVGGLGRWGFGRLVEDDCEGAAQGEDADDEGAKAPDGQATGAALLGKRKAEPSSTPAEKKRNYSYTEAGGRAGED